MAAPEVAGEIARMQESVSDGPYTQSNHRCRDRAEWRSYTILRELELCADEPEVGGGVGWSYDRRRRRAAHLSSAAAAWLYGRRRQTGWESTETAHSLEWTGAGHPLLNRRCTRLPGCIRLRNDLYCVEWGVKLYSLTHSLWFYSGQPLHLWSLLGRWRRKNCEYACCAQFHSRNEFLHGGSYKCNVECSGDADVYRSPADSSQVCCVAQFLIPVAE